MRSIRVCGAAAKTVEILYTSRIFAPLFEVKPLCKQGCVDLALYMHG